jgi:transcriptional regulator with XRE-family HTH domain
VSRQVGGVAKERRYAEFANRLREVMDAQGLMTIALAERLGVSPGTAYDWSDGYFLPYPRRRAEVAAAVGMSVAALFAGYAPSVTRRGVRSTERFPTNLRAVMDKRHLNPKDLARLLFDAHAKTYQSRTGRTKERNICYTIERWLRGVQLPDIYYRSLLCVVLKVSYGELFSGVPVPKDGVTRKEKPIRICKRCEDQPTLRTSIYCRRCSGIEATAASCAARQRLWPPVQKVREVLLANNITTCTAYRTWKARPAGLPRDVPSAYGGWLSVLPATLKDRDYVILAMFNAGMHYLDIATATGLGNPSVYRIRRQMRAVEANGFKQLRRPRPGPKPRLHRDKH